jgi:hypothetical protein
VLIPGSTWSGRKVVVAVEAFGVGVYGEGGGEAWWFEKVTGVRSGAS